MTLTQKGAAWLRLLPEQAKVTGGVLKLADEMVNRKQRKGRKNPGS